MYKDEIIEEVWKNRKAYVDRHNHNLEQMIEDLMIRQKQSDRKIIDRRSMSNNQTKSSSG